ncbi:hypothetical protein ASPZODRAFT_132538 [Penicilliopsis zonata CBS 506.65]|uniref:Uncharacterized protein n=1 Tax=Penicilliopsis zonata CBS 506.65 TaxID=1073090 RepID=A0A1L9SGU5_9EURO|nr:hypothetical protein ASPZODRAFT_132538 [Penicilliopsis zonata CBS 506.65]OJJ46460.1 hypothetical protein ASPZODRAFT_132538 [Penicilliopsis zonata CBS 506.65]
MEADSISFLSAYWGLFPLAVTAILQPSGRVCGFDPQLRIYLRGSPIVCIADFLGLLVRFSVYFVHTGSARHALRRTLQYRRPLYADERGPAGLRELHKVPFLRLVVFVIGIIQAVKLLGCSGLPWTKTWVYCYLIPVCVDEILALLSHHLEEHRPSVTLGIFHYVSVDTLCDRLEHTLGLLAIYTQWLIFFICIKATSLFQTKGAPPETYLEASLCFLFCSFMVVLFHAPDQLINLFSSSSTARRPTDAIPRMLLYAASAALTIAFCMVSPYIDAPRLLMYFGGLIFLYSTIWLLVIALADKSRLFRDEVLFLPDTFVMARNHIAFHNLLFFLAVLILGLVGYGLSFDSEGTYRPSWARWLG